MDLGPGHSDTHNLLGGRSHHRLSASPAPLLSDPNCSESTRIVLGEHEHARLTV